MKKVFRIITNKFLLTAIGFGVWILYFDQNDWITQQQRKKELQETKANIAYLQSEVARMRKERIALKQDPKALEQFAREHYRMKRNNEDVYIFE